MQHDTPLISTIAIGLVLAFVFGALATRLRVSPLVGYLIAGIAVGPHTPGFIADAKLSQEISEIGVILLMFGVGLHFSLKDLLEVKGIAVPGAIVQIVVATLLGMGLGAALGWSLGAGLVFGLALSVASTVVLLRALEQRQMLDTQRGRIAVGWLIVEDLVMVLALVLLPAISPLLGGVVPAGAGHGSDHPLAIELLLTLGKVALFVVVMVVGGARAVPWILDRVAGTGSRELFTLSVLAIALGIAYGSAKVFGVSFALGAFFAGMVLNESEFSHKAAADSLPLRDAFAVLFFVAVGMLFNPEVLLTHPLPVLATLLVIVVGKSLAALLIVRVFGHPMSTAVTIAASLAQVGEFSFILASLGVTLGLLPQLGSDLVLAGAILSITLNPLLLSLIDRKREAATADASTGHAILVGYGRVGRLVGRQLQESAVPFVVIEDSLVRVRELRESGVRAVLGNAASVDVLDLAGVKSARWLLIAIPNGLEAGQIALHGRARNSALDITARAHFDAEVDHLVEHGVDLVIMGEREIAKGMISRVGLAPA
jgi:CPA2 family monovalent cation:H+ antiporter-2